LATGQEKNSRTRRDYRPTVEGLEALRMLSAAAQAHPLPGVVAAHDQLAESAQHSAPLGDDASVSTAAWDAALVETQLSELLSPAGKSAPTTTAAPNPTATSASDRVATASGLSQLNKYLSRAWYRAGIPAQLHDDSSQAVYATLLQNMGRTQFDTLLADVGHSGIKDVFNRETSDGLALFRAVDMVKKRSQRERIHQSLDAIDVASTDRGIGTPPSMREALREAIDQTLSPREAALIQDTLMGKTPAEIAIQWGVAPKTVSNEKTRVLQKLRSALADYELN
jgi:DNA-binding CsgD family transcriptional regulator